MNADSVVRKRDVSNVCGNLRHVACDAIVGRIAVKPLFRIEFAGTVRVMAIHTNAKIMRLGLLRWNLCMTAVTRRASKTVGSPITGALMHLFDVSHDFHTRIGRLQSIVDVEVCQRKSGSEIVQASTSYADHRLAH